jgi:hypothetical protein
LPLDDTSFCFRKGDVGGERGFDATVAFRTGADPVELDGDSKKTNITTHNITPTMIVSGLVRRNDRTGPMAPLYCWVSSMDEISRPQNCMCRESAEPQFVSRRSAASNGRLSSLPQCGERWNDCAVKRMVVNYLFESTLPKRSG